MKRLYKSESNKVWCGVFGGVGEYLDLDPVILRIIWVVITCFSAFLPGIAVYFLACIIIPKQLKIK